MPKSIVLFERVAYSALILGLASVALNWPAVSDFYDQNPMTYLLMQIATLGGQIVFIWLIARRRKNWARWVWVGIIFVGTAFAIVAEGAGPVRFIGLIPAIAYYLVYLVSLTSACLLLTPTSRAWFHSKSGEADI